MHGEKLFGYVNNNNYAPPPLLPPSSPSDILQPNPDYDFWFEQDELILNTLIFSYLN